MTLSIRLYISMYTKEKLQHKFEITCKFTRKQTTKFAGPKKKKRNTTVKLRKKGLLP